MTRRWVIRRADPSVVAELSAELGLSKPAAAVLAGRSITDLDSARRYLQPDLAHLHSPLLLPDIEVAVNRLLHALEQKQIILIHGDYDADGLTATALLSRALRRLGGRVLHHVPHRIREGYDIKADIVRWAADQGVSLIITVDCGVGAFEAIQEARRLGIDVVVTDHHHPGSTLPPAVAVVNPVRADSAYPFHGLAGVAVALKLLCALCEAKNITVRSAYRAFLDLVALGTCADASPLVDENRVLAKFGLHQLRNSKKVGIQALIAEAGIGADVPLTAWHVGFVLAPRLNAAGRLQDPTEALQLLLTNDEAEARRLAHQLGETNARRRLEQERILAEAKAQVNVAELASARMLVVRGEGWHPGVVGIVASKLVDIYRRPAAVIAIDGDTARGSARSLGSFHLVKALDRCEDLLQRYGGHRLAAGFDVRVEAIPELTQRLLQVAGEMVTDDDLRDELEIDAWIDPIDLTPQLWHEVEMMEPFGEGNPVPLFASRMLILSVQRIGRTGDHLLMTVRGEGMNPMEAIWWGKGALADRLKPGKECSLCYRLDTSAYLGRDTIRLAIEDLTMDGAAISAAKEDAYDPFEPD
ncbi:MAG: single-stranded-DNA-specific exonuclease RecJ [Armatimonadota bacterium]